MSDIELQFADDDHGDPVTVPATTAKIYVSRHKPGEPGAPKRLHTGKKRYSLPPDAPDTALAELPADWYRLQPVDAKEKRIGQAFYVEVIHLDGGPEADTPGKAAPKAIDAERERFYEELRQERQELRAMVKETNAQLQKFAEMAFATMTKIAETMSRSVEASASVVTAARGGGFSEMMNEVREVIDAAPEAGSTNLETVLNSPVVVGAAAALQKYMAQAAQNGAEAMAVRNGGGGETMAQRAARLAIEANKKSRKN